MREREREQFCLFFRARFRFTRDIIMKIIFYIRSLITIFMPLCLVDCEVWVVRLYKFFFSDAARCTYKAIFLFTALFRSMTHFRKSIKSRLVLSGTWSTNILLWETGLNDSHVGSTTTHRSCLAVPLLNIKRCRTKNTQSIYTKHLQLLLK